MKRIMPKYNFATGKYEWRESFKLMNMWLSESNWNDNIEIETKLKNKQKLKKEKFKLKK